MKEKPKIAKFISPKEAAELSGYGESYIAYLVKNKKVGAMRENGLWLVLQKDILKYEKKRRKEFLGKIRKDRAIGHAQNKISGILPFSKIKEKAIFVEKEISLLLKTALLFLKTSKYGSLILILAIAVLGGIFSLALSPKSETAEIYPTKYEGDWQNIERALSRELSEKADLSEFQYENSANTKEFQSPVETGTLETLPLPEGELEGVGEEPTGSTQGVEPTEAADERDERSEPTAGKETEVVEKTTPPSLPLSGEETINNALPLPEEAGEEPTSSTQSMEPTVTTVDLPTGSTQSMEPAAEPAFEDYSGIILPNIDGELPEGSGLKQEGSTQSMEPADSSIEDEFQSSGKTGTLKEEEIIIFANKKTIVFSGFKLGNENIELKKVKIGFSFASDFSQEGNDKIIVDWSLDGEKWNEAAAIKQNKPVSNKENGGYFYAVVFDSEDSKFGELLSRENIENLKVRFTALTSRSEKEFIPGYLDAVWLETEQIKTKDEDEKGGKIEILSDKMDFKADEEPEFSFKYNRQDKGILASVEKSLGVFDYWKGIKISAAVLNPKGETVEFFTDKPSEYINLDLKDNGEFYIKLKKTDGFKPGVHTLSLKIEEDGEKEARKYQQDFTWGKSMKEIYLDKKDLEIISDSEIRGIKETEVLEKFPRLKQGFQDLQFGVSSSSAIVPADGKILKASGSEESLRENQKNIYALENISVTTLYKESDGVSMASGSRSIKQDIIVENKSSEDANLTLSFKHQIDANSVFWDGKEYPIEETPQIFKAYEKKEIIDPAEYDIEGWPKYYLPVTAGASVSFKTSNGETGMYGWLEAAELDHQVSVYKENGLSYLAFEAKFTVLANSSFTIDPNYDLATGANYNIRFDGGATTSEYLGISVVAGDINGDGLGDLIMGAYTADYNGRANSGSVYVLFSTQVDNYTGTSNEVNLDEASALYNIRFDGGATTSEVLGWSVSAGDINGDGLGDLIMGAYAADYNSRTDSGSVYVLFSTQVDNYIGVSNEVNLDEASALYNIRFDGGATTSEVLGRSVAAGDINGDGLGDLIMGAYLADYNSRDDSGSVYVLFSTQVDNYIGVSNEVNLDEASANYNIRFDGGATTNEYLGRSVAAGDINGDGLGDLIMGAYVADYNSRTNSGSVYVLFSTQVDNYTGTSNEVNLDEASALYNIRFDGGATTGENLGISVSAGDINGDGLGDLIMGAYTADYNGRANSGSVYVLFSTQVDNYTGTSNEVNLDEASALYNIRFDGGATTSEVLGWSVSAGDINGDGLGDLIMGAYAADYNSRTESGSVYVLFSTQVDNYTGTSNEVNLDEASALYNIRFDGGATTSENLGISVSAGDINGDGLGDLIMGAYLADYNSRTESGSVYVRTKSKKGMAAYQLSADAAVPKLRGWNGTDWNAQVNANTVTGTIQWTVVKAHPTRNEVIVGTLDSTNDIKVQICTFQGSCGAVKTMTTSASTSATRVFDIAIEQSSGDVLVVYETGVNQQVSYDVWNGTSWAGAATLAIGTASTLNSYWIDLFEAYDSTSPNPNNMMLAVETAVTSTYPDLYAAPYTGSTNSFGTVQTIAADLEPVTSQGFYGAFEDVSGDFIIFFSSQSSAALQYYTYSGGSWTGPSAGRTSAAAAIFNFRAAVYPDTDRIMACWNVDTTSDDIDCQEWSGTAIQTGASVSASIEATSHPTRALSVAPVLGTNGFLVMYGENAIDYFYFGQCTSQTNCQAGTWSVRIPDTTDMGVDTRWGQLYAEPNGGGHLIWWGTDQTAANGWYKGRLQCDASTCTAVETANSVGGTSSLSYESAMFAFSPNPYAINVSGTSNMTSGMVRVAINGTLQGQTDVIDGSGNWTVVLLNQPATGDIVTVWVDSAAEGSESTAVTKYDGSGNITEMVLNANVLTIGSVDNGSLTVTNLGLYDCNDDEDIMHNGSASSTLAVEGCTNSYASEKISILLGDTLTIGTTETLTTHDVEIAGTLTSGGNSAYTISGSWVNNGTFTASSSTATFTSTTSETLSGAMTGGSSFWNLVFDGIGGSWSFGNNSAAIANNFTITNGAVTAPAGAYTFTIGGNWSNSGTFTHNSGTATFNSGWLDSGWSYRKRHTMYNSASAQTNYQMKIIVNYGAGTDSGDTVYCNSNCQTDFDDVRFTDSNGATLIDYWRESYTASTTATFWVEIPSVPASGYFAIYIYYGNGSVSTTSNGANTFWFYDDFESYNLGDLAGQGGWTGTGVSVQNTLVYEGTRAITYQSTDKTATHAISQMAAGTVTFYMRRDTTTSTKMTMSIYGGAAEFTRYSMNNDANMYANDGSELLQAYSANTWYKVEIIWNTTSIISVRINDILRASGLSRSAITGIDSFTFTGGGLLSSTNAYVDFINVRKYASTEPSHTSWGSEAARTKTIASGGSSFYNMTFNDANSAWTFSAAATVANDFTITAGAVTAPSTTLTIARNFTNNGTFTHNNGTVTFNTTATSQLTYAANTTFYALTSSTAGKILEFDETAAVQTIITNALTIQGTNCTTNRIFLRAIGDVADDWEIVVTGATLNIDYADIKRSTAITTTAVADNSTNGGNNTNWTITAGACGGGITISGVAYTDDGVSTLNSSDGVFKVVNNTTGNASSSAGGTDGTGNWSITGVTAPSVGDILTIWINGGTADGTLLLEYGATCTGYTNCTGLSLYQNRVMLRSENDNALANSDLAGCDNDSTGVGTECADTEIGFTSNANNLETSDGRKLIIWTGETLTAGGTVTTSVSNDGTDSVADGDLLIQSGATLTMAANALSVGGDYVNSGTFSSSGTATFTAINTGFDINPGGSSFNNVTFNGASGGWTAITNTFTVGGALTITAGNFDTGAVINAITGATSVTGTLTVSSITGTKTFTGDVTINAGGTWNETAAEDISFGGSLANNQTFTASTGVHTFTGTGKSISGTVSIPNLTIDVSVTNNNALTVSTALSGLGTLTNAATGTLNIGGTSGITGLTATASGNTVNYNGAGAQTVKAVSYHHLTLSNGGAKTMTSVTTIGGDLSISGSATMTSNSAFTATGALNYSSSGGTTLTAATAISIGTYNQSAGTFVDNGNTITVTGTGASTWVKSGTFTATGTANFTGAAPQIGASNFNNLTITSSGTATLAGAVTASNNLLISTGVLDIGANTLGVTNDITATGTLQGTGNVTVNGNVTGAGFVTLTGGTFEQIVAANKTFGSSAGSNSWTFNNLKFNNSDGVSARTITPNAGTGTITVSGTLTLGDSGTQNITFDNETSNDRIFDINGSILISTRGIFSASSSELFTLAGNFTDNKATSGGFTPNNGTVTIDGAGASTFDGANTPAITFYNFTSTTAGKNLTFTAGKTFRINGKLTITGTSGAGQVVINSTTASQWFINHQGTEDVTYANITYSGCDGSSTNISLNNTSTNGGNNGSCWLFPSLSFTLSKTSMSMNLTTPNWMSTDSVIATITSRSQFGYQLTAYITDSLRHTGYASTIIQDFQGTNAAPDDWGSTCVAGGSAFCGFGYTTDDDEILTGSPSNRFTAANGVCSAAPCYARFVQTASAPGEVVADSATAISGDATQITLKTSVSYTQQAGTYQTTIVFIATPWF